MKQSVEASGKTLSKSLDVINSVRITGLDGTADILERGKTFVSETVPEHSNKSKDNLGETANALLDHGSNTISSLTKVATGVFKQADEVQGTATDEVNIIVEGVGNVGKSAIQNTGKVTGKVSDMSQRALQTIGTIVTDPAKYASASVGYVKDTAGTGVRYLKAGATTGAGYIQDRATTGVSYLKDKATTGMSYLKDKAKAINPMTPLKKMASFLPFSWF